jgi:flavoredoxin
MKRDIETKPALFPMPVLMVATYDEGGTVNVMNAAWGMISDMDKITLFLDEGHKTTANIRAVRAFTVSLADRDHIAEADFFRNREWQQDAGQVRTDGAARSEE